MNRLSANIGFLWNDLPLLDRIARAAAAGFAAVELHSTDDISAKDLRDICKNQGLLLVSLNSEAGDPTRGEFGLAALAGKEDVFRAGLLRSMDYAEEAGAHAVHVLAGQAGTSDLSRDVFLENLRFGAEHAIHRGLRLLLEPMNRSDRPGYFYSRPEHVAELLDLIGSDNVGMLFDAYHTAMEGLDLIDEFVRYRRYIKHVQVASAPLRQEPDDQVIAFLAQVDRSDYQGRIGCEYRPKSTPEAGFHWISEIKAADQRASSADAARRSAYAK